MNEQVTVKRSFTDMTAKYGASPQWRYRVDITTYHGTTGPITSFGKYFPTKAQAKAYIQEMS